MLKFTQGEILASLSSAVVCGLLGFFVGKKLAATSKPDVTPEERLKDETSSEDESSSDEEESGTRFKMVLLVRTDLKMQKGKQMAQCAHASLMAYQKIHSRKKSSRTPLQQKHVDWARQWNRSGCAKVALKISSKEQAKELMSKAKLCQLPFCKVLDAGRTQIAAGSMTVVAIGPAPVDQVDSVAGSLKLM